MDAASALAELEAAGTAQNRKVYGRHGAPAPLFGVSFATLRALGKRAGVDHDLAQALWASGNTDARCLAMLVADPHRLDVATADAWARESRYHVLADLVGAVVARAPLAIDRMSQWVASSDEWVSRCGWAVMSQLAVHQPEVPDAAFTPYLSVIERRIGDAPNRTREAMNTALIAIGSRSKELMTPAIAAAERIGPVEIDHGETGCKTADAVPYIRKALAHKQKSKQGKGEGKGKGKVAAKQPPPVAKKPVAKKPKPAVAKKPKPAAAKKPVAKKRR